MISDPLVSIILPTWNRGGMLPKAVERILSQSYKNFELIVVDDGSVDDTSKIMQRILERTKDSRIRYLPLPSHVGGAAARNIGIKESNGQLIASQDDDDEWDPQYLEMQVKNLLSLPSDYGMTFCAYWRFLPGGKKVKMPPASFKPKSGNLLGGDIMKKNYGPFQTAVIKREVFDDVGYVCDKIDSLYDWEMWFRVIKKYKVGFVPQRLFTWNFTPNSNSGDPKKIWNRINARNYILENYGTDIKKFGYYAAHMSRLIDLYMEAGETFLGIKSALSGIAYAPTSWILWLKIISSFLGSSVYMKLLRARKN